MSELIDKYEQYYKKCPKCGSTDIDEEGAIDYVDDDKKESIYYLNMCRQCKHLFDKKAEGK